MLRILTTLMIGLALAGSAGAQDLDAKAVARIVAPYVNNETQMVGHVTVQKVDLDKYFEPLITVTRGDKRARQEATGIRDFAMAQKAKLMQAGIRDIMAVVNLDDFQGSMLPEIILIAPLGKNADVDDLLKLIGQIPGFTAKVENNKLIARFGAVIRAQTRDRPEFAEGLEAFKGYEIRIIASPSANLRRFGNQERHKFSSIVEGDDFSLLARMVRWFGLGYVTSKQTQHYILQTRDVQTARYVKELAEKTLAGIEKRVDAPAEFAKLRSLLEFKQQGTRVSLVGDDKIINAMMAPAVANVRRATERTESINNLKLISLGMLLHNDAMNRLPARANFDKTGKPLLSWRVHILPYVEQNELYKQFKLEEPWDSPNNKKLIASIPAVYASPLSRAGKEGKTTYLAVTGKNSIFDGNLGIRFQDVTDGASNTIMVVEANDKKAVYWTQPEDFPIDTKDPLTELVLQDMKGFFVAFADGSIRVLSAKIRPATLQGLFTRNGGETVDPDD